MLFRYLSVCLQASVAAALACRFAFGLRHKGRFATQQLKHGDRYNSRESDQNGAVVQFVF